MSSSFRFVSSTSQIDWPQVPEAWAGRVAALLYQFEQTQWWPPEELRHQQLQQAGRVLEHAYASSGLYRNLYDCAGIRPHEVKTWDAWSRLPVVSRADLQAAGASWHSDSPPKDHGELLQHCTSGSSGMPLHAQSTHLTHLLKVAAVLRQHQWARRDTQTRLALIQETGDASLPLGRHNDHWEVATQNVIQTGPALTLSVRSSEADQMVLLQDFKPAYLIGYPSAIAALARHSMSKGLSMPFLKQVGTFGEILDATCRGRVQEAWGVRVVDMYSAMEMGPIALQCPDHEHYHVQSEAVLLEVLDESGRECAPGEIGRVVLTSLHNFAAPMIRYEIGDYAEKGAPCLCGRSLPVLNRVIGRRRNMLCYPDGSLRWPSLSQRGMAGLMTAEMPPLKQFQLIQHSTQRLEARAVLSRPYTAQEETLVADSLRGQLGAHWQIHFSYPSFIERGAGGKYEDFISRCH